MKLVLEKASDFKKAIDAISGLIDEAEFIISSESLSLKATDPSQISMIDFLMEKKAFKEFNVEKETKIGLDLEQLSQIMSRCKAGDSLDLELDQQNSRLKITFKGHSIRKFFIPLLDLSSAEIPSPKIDFDANLKIKAEVLQDGLKDASLVSTHLTLGVTGEKFFLRASSSKGNVENDTSKNEKGLIELNAKQECTSMFPLDYLTDMVKAASSDTTVELNLKSNAPIQLSYSIGEAKLKYFLAPRIEN